MNQSPLAPATAAQGLWPAGSGELPELIRRHDWERTALGSIAHWPQSLRAMVDLVVASPVPMIILWGPDLVQIYNDDYRMVMGNKHPGGLGQKTRDCWPEVWHINEPIYRGVFAGEAFTFNDSLYPLNRHGT